MTVMTILFNSFLYYFLFIFFNYFHRSVTSVIKLINSLYLGIKIVTVNNKNDDRLKLHGIESSEYGRGSSKTSRRRPFQACPEMV